MLVADEAAGIPEQVFEAAGGSMSTPGAITILAGNPTRTTGFFWRTHMLESHRWYCKRVSCLDSPRVDPAYAVEVAERYGIDSNRYRVRVLGEFPLAEGDTMIPGRARVDDAMARPPEHDEHAPEIWGVDCARFGEDASVLIKRKGNAVIEPARRWQWLGHDAALRDRSTRRQSTGSRRDRRRQHRDRGGRRRSAARAGAARGRRERGREQQQRREVRPAAR
jgi:phage terminase large subunit